LNISGYEGVSEEDSLSSSSWSSELAAAVSKDVAALFKYFTPVEGAWDLTTIPSDLFPDSFQSLTIKGIPSISNETPYITYISGSLTALYGNARESYLGEIATALYPVTPTAAPILAPPVFGGAIYCNGSYVKRDIVLASMGLVDPISDSELMITSVPVSTTTKILYMFFAATFTTLKGETDLSTVLAIGPLFKFNTIQLSVKKPVPAEALSVKYYVCYAEGFGYSASIPIKDTFNNIIGWETEDTNQPFSGYTGSKVLQTVESYLNFHLLKEVTL
jgi:hypothetical protein